MLQITTEETILTTTTMTYTTTRMDYLEAEWRCVLEGGMGQCAMTSGITEMPPLSAHNSDSLPMVSVIVRENNYNFNNRVTCMCIQNCFYATAIDFEKI